MVGYNRRVLKLWVSLEFETNNIYMVWLNLKLVVVGIHTALYIYKELKISIKLIFSRIILVCMLFNI